MVIFYILFIIQMISCNFCGGKNQNSYLFLTCKHLSCLTCAFQKSDFSTLLIECCRKATKIDQDAMAMIISCRKKVRALVSNNQNKSIHKTQIAQSVPDNKQITSKTNTKQNQPIGQNLATIVAQTKNSNKITIPQASERKKQNLNQQDSIELENILIMQIDRIKREFEIQRMLLKEKEDNLIKDLLSTYEQQIKNIQKPISQAKLQKFNLSLNKHITFSTTKRFYGQQSTRENFADSGNLKKSRESYDHILKKLQMNQQRMKQKIQRHLGALY